MEESILSGIFFLITVASFFYALSKLPKRIDYGKIKSFAKTYFFKISTIGLLLYSVWITWIHEKSEKEYWDNRDELYDANYSLDSLRTEHIRLQERIDSLTRKE